MKILCEGCAREIEVPSEARNGHTFECPN